mgnify:FL=1
MLELVKRPPSDKSEFQTHLANFERFWADEFSDLPWRSQPIKVTPNPALQTLDFYFIFENLDEFPQVDVSLNETDDLDPSVVEFTWKNAEAEPGLFLTISGLRPDQLNHLIFSQHPDAIKPAKLVCLQKDGPEWVVIYNSFDRFKDMTKKWSAQNATSVSDFDVKLFKFIEFLMASKFSEANQFFEQTAILSDKKKEFSSIVEKFDVAFNAHGIKRTFKYWSRKERQTYLQSALAIIDVLKPKFENICISGGSILGLERTGRLLDHDDDLDLVVGVKPSDFGGLGPTLDALAARLYAAGYKIKGYFFAHLWVETDRKSVV